MCVNLSLDGIYFHQHQSSTTPIDLLSMFLMIIQEFDASIFSALNKVKLQCVASRTTEHSPGGWGGLNIIESFS